MQDVFASPGSIAFELGPLQIRWYGILMATAILVGFWLAHRRALQEGLPADQLVRAAQWAVVAGLSMYSAKLKMQKEWKRKVPGLMGLVLR